MTRRLFLTADGVGGVWQYAAELARALQPRGYDVTIAVLGPAVSDAQRATLAPGVILLDTGLPLDWLADDATAVAATAATLARLADAQGADVVQLNQPAFAADGSFAMPVVVAAHSCVGTWWQAVRGDTPEPAEFVWQTDLMQRGLARADAVVAPSHAFAAALQRRYRLSTAPHVVHNGRAPITATPSGTSHDSAFTAGRLWDEGKNIATLDRAAARVGVPLTAAGALVGANGQRATLTHLDTLGQVDEAVIADHLAARPIFVSAALYEPFGLAVLEAALAGCPLVLADIATFRELWDGAAIFVDPHDDAGFAAAIDRLIADASSRQALGDRARQRAAHFTPDRMADAMDALFGALLGTAHQQVAA